MRTSMAALLAALTLPAFATNSFGAAITQFGGELNANDTTFLDNSYKPQNTGKGVDIVSSPDAGGSGGGRGAGRGLGIAVRADVLRVAVLVDLEEVGEVGKCQILTVTHFFSSRVSSYPLSSDAT